MTLSRRLKRWQGPRTAAQAAADLGVNRRTYENWIQGRKKPSGLALTTLLNLIADADPEPSKRPNTIKP
jgi:DNA-binding transcriptional regulator YiaG